MTNDEMQARIVELERKNAELETRLQIAGDMLKKFTDAYWQEIARSRRTVVVKDGDYRSIWDFVGL